MNYFLPGGWVTAILASAVALGFYDICKKHAVRDNSVMPVLFFATLTGSTVFVAGSALSGGLAGYFSAINHQWWLVFAKSLLVATSWTCVYYAMRELPISIASPIRASSPLWTVLGGIFIFDEHQTGMQLLGMLAIFAGYYAFSLIGKREGFPWRSHGMILIVIGTILGAGSALYDKYLLGILKIDRGFVQFWFSVDLVFILGLGCLARMTAAPAMHRFKWRWSIPATGALLIAADWLYFYAVSQPDTNISTLSLMRRCSCVVTFALGSWYFRDRDVKIKAVALASILTGVFLLAWFR
ncbi:MAG: DMT family transporter [Victivallaceae bacterium]|nr:DMT family transporter [Victivallaceae bacterium]